MDIVAFRSLMKELIRHQLVTKEQIQSCVKGIKKGESMGIDLLDTLQKRDLLTPYQVDRIKHLDFASVVLGGNKLLYLNSSGSFARVFRASDPDGKIIAIKVLRNRYATDEETVSLFRKEAEMGMKLKHPNIVPIYSIGHEGEHHYFTMEFVEGGNLKDFIKIRKQLSPEEACKTIFEIASGLDYALTQGCTHRDLKTTNVLMSTKGVAKLIDFGLAVDETKFKNIDDEKFQVAIEYSTLEKGTGAPRNDPRSDLYFLGVIFYELLTGQPPYPPTRDRAERKQITRYRSVRPLSTAHPDLPRQVTYIVDRLMHFNPVERYQSATEVLSDLNRYLQANPAVSPIHSPAAASDASNSGVQSPVERPLVMLLDPIVREENLVEKYLTSRGFEVRSYQRIDDVIANMFLKAPACLLLAGDSYETKIADVFRKMSQLAVKEHAGLVVITRAAQQGLLSSEDVNRDHIAVLKHPFQLRELRQQITRLAAAGNDSKDSKDSTRHTDTIS